MVLEIERVIAQRIAFSRKKESLGMMICFYIIIFLFEIILSKKLLYIGWDGTKISSLEDSSTTSISTLLETGGKYFNNIRSVLPTDSSPNWSSIFTGVCPVKHGIHNNGDIESRHPKELDARYPIFTKYIKEYYNNNFDEIFVGGFVHWKELGKRIFNANYFDVNEYGLKDDLIPSYLLEILKVDDFDKDSLYIAVFDHVDRVGHFKGGGFDDSKMYIKAIKLVDLFTMKILTEVMKRIVEKEEEWLVILSSDHGGLGHEHGGNSNVERRTWLACSTLDKEREIDLPQWLNHEDTFSVTILSRIIFHYFGVPVEESWELDEPTDTCIAMGYVNPNFMIFEIVLTITSIVCMCALVCFKYKWDRRKKEILKI